MVFGFALEPELVATWGERSEYRYFFDQFGIGQPRLMVEFPKMKNWRRQALRAAADLGEIERQRVTAIIGILMERAIPRIPAAEYDGTRPWLENAEEEHSAHPFHAILAKENPHGHEAILTRELLESGDPRWKLGRTKFPSRNAAQMAYVVSELLRNSTEVIFVDPHFGPENARHRRPLEAFLAALMKDRAFPVAKVLVLSASAATPEFFSGACNERLPRIIPSGLMLEVCQLQEKAGGEKLHNRYILTDIGGVTFQVGLDDGDDGQTDDVGLMEREQYQFRWSQYSGGAPAFICRQVVPVTGKKRL